MFYLILSLFVALLISGCSPAATGYDGPLAVTGADGVCAFEADPKTAVELSVTSPVNWTSMNKLDWVRIIPSSGGAGRTTKVLVMADENPFLKARDGVISFSAGVDQVILRVSQRPGLESVLQTDPDNPAENIIGEPVVPPPFDPGGTHKNPTDPAVIAWWTLGENDYMYAWNQSLGNAWIGSGWIKADWPDKSEAIMDWHLGTDTKTERTYILSSDGNGHWAVKPTWEGDNLVITVPVNGFERNDVITIRFGMSGVASVPKYWLLDYSLDGTSWTTLSPQTFKEGTDSFTATVRLSGAGNVYDVDESFTLTSDYSGDVRFRLMATHAKYQTGGGTGSGPTSGSSLRIRPMSANYGSQKGLAVFVNKKD